MSHNTYEGIKSIFPISSISLALLFFYFIIIYSYCSNLINLVFKFCYNF